MVAYHATVYLTYHFYESVYLSAYHWYEVNKHVAIFCLEYTCKSRIMLTDCYLMLTDWYITKVLWHSWVWLTHICICTYTVHTYTYMYIHLNHENILHLKLHSLMHSALTKLEFYIAYTVNRKLESKLNECSALGATRNELTYKRSYAGWQDNYLVFGDR